ncbi:hypothetical protein [Acetobacterium wieringae]|uniref:hypothetical protein n=1 Tax=Acetobacterium wieringae TaxID=52694 RepID=UPI002B21F5C3|nr:hypothetical protein [Acetobacterium wieringae]MEA4805097.1 hypothetical protein [Acetobacterium wieringae]
MASYARKPQTIEAHQWNGDVTQKMPEWLYDSIMNGDNLVFTGRRLFLNNQDGEEAYQIDDGDYIVREADGSLSTRHPGVFESEWYLLK